MTLNGEDKELVDSLCPNERDKFEQWFKELNNAQLTFITVKGVYLNRQMLNAGSIISPTATHLTNT